MISKIQEASSLVHKFINPTPLLEHQALNELINGNVLLKAEFMQPTGSFKLRGALYAISKLSPDQRNNGVLAYSSGNHGIGVAYAAKRFDISATVVVPKDIPEAKLAKITEFGAEIIFYDRGTDNREKIGSDIAKERGLSIIKPYDHIDTIIGQGTCGLEVLEQSSLRLDCAIVCTGGGGLMAGMGTALRDKFPSIQLFTAEPIGWDDHMLSFVAGKRIECVKKSGGICDGLLTATPGEKTFTINQRNNVVGLNASEEHVLEAMHWAFKNLEIELEPSGAVALACFFQNQEKFKDKNVLITLTGGNVDSEKYLKVFS